MGHGKALSVEEFGIFVANSWKRKILARKELDVAIEIQKFHRAAIKDWKPLRPEEVGSWKLQELT